MGYYSLSQPRAHYEYKKESENFYGIYEEYSNTLITHKTSKRGAKKLVELMNMAFDCGYWLHIDHFESSGMYCEECVT